MTEVESYNQSFENARHGFDAALGFIDACCLRLTVGEAMITNRISFKIYEAFITSSLPHWLKFLLASCSWMNPCTDESGNFTEGGEGRKMHK